MRPVKPSDWFRNDKAVAYGKWRSVAFDNFISKIKPRKNGRKPFGFKDSMLNAPKLLHIKTSYFCIKHTPLPLKRSVFEDFFNENPQALALNLSHKFRHETQFNPQALFYLIAFKSGKCIKESTKKDIFIKPEKKKINYALRKIKEFENNENILFGCISSADMAEESVRNKLFDWIKSLLKINQ
jgi:hypothetical protein